MKAEKIKKIHFLQERINKLNYLLSILEGPAFKKIEAKFKNYMGTYSSIIICDFYDTDIESICIDALKEKFKKVIEETMSELEKL